MPQHVETLNQLARIAIEGPAAKETLDSAASIIRQATGAAEAMVVYAEDRDFLACTDAGDGAVTDFTQTALWIVQRQIVELGGPVAFNLVGHRVEDFTSAGSDEQREFLALSMPTSEGASEMCILRGVPEHKGWTTILQFMESATPALTIILERFLNADRSQRLGEQLNTLANAAQLLTQSDDLQAALTDLATAIAGATATDYLSIDVYDTDSGRFVLRALNQSRFAGLPVTQAWIESLDPDRPDPRNLEVMRSRQPYLSTDVQNDEREPEAVRRYFEATLIRSMATFPVLFQDEFLGTVAFVYYAPHTFPQDEVNFLRGFVTQAATALKALQMHNKVQQYADELKRSADDYIATTNMTGDIIVRLDARGRWSLLNDAACQFFGKPRHELLGAQSTDYVHPEDIASTTQAIRETRARKELVRGFVHRFLTAMGTRVVEWNAWPLFDEQGQYAGNQITGRDITERKRAEDALAAKTKEYIGTTNLTGDLIARLDKHGNWAFLNDAACQFFGKPREELLGTDSRAFAHPDDLESTAQAIRETRARKELVRGFVNRQLTPMGTRVVEWNGYPIFDEEGKYAGIQITGRDITEHKQMEEALRESEARYRLLAETTSDIIWIVDIGLKYTYISPAVTRMRGYTVEEIKGASISETMTPASLEIARKTLAEQLALEGMGHADPDRAIKLELEMYCKDGSTIWTEMNMTFLRDSDGKPTGILGTTRDISERKQMEAERERLHAELEEKAITDGLTGLYNHAHFYQRLDEEIERSSRYKHGFAVVMMDVNNFKQYNDSRGHQAGDEALRLIADCIRTSLRRSDLAFRYGGDEFAAILPHAKPSRAQAVIDRINKRIAAGLGKMGDAAAVWLSLSAGVSWCPEDATTVDELVQIADAALYNAKRVAWAQEVMVQEEALESPTAASAVVQEAQSGMLSTAANSLAAVLQQLGASELGADLDQDAIAAVQAAAEAKDRYIRGHQERTSLWAAALAEEMGLPPERVRDIRIASLLHDIGNIGVKDGILNKPGKLTKEEFAKVKQHAPFGAKIMGSEAEALQQLAKIVRHHHERYDGKGYPDGLAGKDIPLEARILSVVDAFDAMTQERSYRKALSREEAIRELERSAGTQFDPAVVKAFLALVKEPRAESSAPVQAASKERQLAAATAVKRKGR